MILVGLENRSRQSIHYIVVLRNERFGLSPPRYYNSVLNNAQNRAAFISNIDPSKALNYQFKMRPCIFYLGSLLEEKMGHTQVQFNRSMAACHIPLHLLVRNTSLASR